MSAAAQHGGLPFVPKPAHDELLGSWLLRLAQLYGLGLATLLSRLGVRPITANRIPHWFALSGASLSLDALSQATRLSRAHLAAMAPPACRPRWPEELGACERCLADAAEAGQPITWRRGWMNPLATVCSVHGVWLTPVPIRALTRVRHAEDFGSLLSPVGATQALADDGPNDASDALWLQIFCTKQTLAHLPWGRSRPHELIRIVDALAREVICAAKTDGFASMAAADRPVESAKDFVFADVAGQLARMSLPTRLRCRQQVLARVAHVLRRQPVARTFHASWSVASVHRLALVRDWPDGALSWVCPEAAELARREDALRTEFSISPRYFKAYSALLASFQRAGSPALPRGH